jgi:Protein of unknown function (DUF3489)
MGAGLNTTETEMTNLSDTQAIILSAASQRADRNILPLPGSLRGGAARNVVAALLKRGLIAETATDGRVKADAALNRIWRNDTDGRAILLHISDAGLAAIGIDPDDADSAPTSASEAPSAVAAEETPAELNPAPKARTSRPGTKQEAVIEMLRAEGGATIDEIVAATAWRHHTVRGFFAGALKKRLGLDVTSEKVEGRGRIYKLPPA